MDSGVGPAPCCSRGFTGSFPHWSNWGITRGFSLWKQWQHAQHRYLACGFEHDTAVSLFSFSDCWLPTPGWQNEGGYWGCSSEDPGEHF